MPGGPAQDVALGDEDRRSATAGQDVGHQARPTEPGRVDRRRLGPLLVVAALTALLAAPLVLSLAYLVRPRWYPVLDLAMTELRLRDVLSRDPPLIGLSGRIGPIGDQGSHPGPLSFYALWPFYRVFGAGPWAMQAAAVALNALAMAGALWIGARRGGMRLVVGLAAALALLVRLYGPTTLTEPWNPYLPALWWIVLLLTVWSVLDDDLPMLPAAVGVGSLCMQTHIPYLGLGGGLVALAGAAALLSVYRRRADQERRRPALRWFVAAAAVGALAWLPPVIDELTRSPGNLSVLWDYFGSPSEEPVGLRRGVELLLQHLNPTRLLAADPLGNDPRGSLVPGTLALVAEVAAVLTAWRLQHRTLLRLHVVLGAALLLGVVTLSRIFGFVWFYLGLWAYGTSALLLLAVGWTAASAVARRLDAPTERRWARAGGVVLAGIVTVSVGLFALDAPEVEVLDPDQSRILAGLVGPTVAALETGDGLGRDARYLVSWDIDQVGLGAQGFGLLLELERRGFDVGAVELHQAGATRHRVRAIEESDTVVHLAVGPDIEVWRAKPLVTEVAYQERRSAEEQAEYERLNQELLVGLEDAGLGELVPQAERIPFVAALDPRLPDVLYDRIQRMIEIGLPSAVFVGLPSSLPPP